VGGPGDLNYSARQPQEKTSNMATTVTAIYRYPVKGLSAEKLNRVSLTPGECLPHDRRFAIALGSTPFDPEHPEWLSKTHFIMLMRDEKLAQLRTRFEAESGILEIAENGQVLLRARMTEPEGCRLIAEFFEGFLGNGVKGPLCVVAAPGHAFADAGASRMRRPTNTSRLSTVRASQHSKRRWALRSIPFDFARTCISTGRWPGVSTTGLTPKSLLEPRGWG
jgi:hypothetical protein